MDDLYQENILDHFKNPRYQGQIEDSEVVVEETNASCGDEIKLFLKTEGQGDQRRVVDISWLGNGCAISQASSSLLAEKIKLQSPLVTELEKLNEADMLALLGLEDITPGRKKCLRLSLVALQKALKSLKK